MNMSRIIAYFLVLVLVVSGMSVCACAVEEASGSGEPDILSAAEAVEEVPQEFPAEKAPEEIPEAEPEEEISAEAPEELSEDNAGEVSEESEEAPAEEETEETPAEEEESSGEPDTAAEEADVPFAALPVDGDAGEPDLTKLSISWDNTPVQFTVTDTMCWDPEGLCWVDDTDNTGTIELVENTNIKTFTITNASEDALTISVQFTQEEGLPDAISTCTVSGSGDVSAAGTTNLTATVDFNFTDVHPPKNMTDGTLGTFTLKFDIAV